MIRVRCRVFKNFCMCGSITEVLRKDRSIVRIRIRVINPDIPANAPLLIQSLIKSIRVRPVPHRDTGHIVIYGNRPITIGDCRALLLKFCIGYIPIRIEWVEGIVRQLESLLQHRDEWNICLNKLKFEHII
jgi:hypothetical protein